VTTTHAFSSQIAVFSPRLTVSKLSLQERVRHRFKGLVESKGVQHDTLAKRLGLSRSGVTRLLNDEGSGFALHHIERLCEFFQITPAEVMAEPGALIQPVTPIEAAFLAHLRQMTELERRSLLTILERPIYAAPDKKARLGRAMLSPKEQELVDLFARVKRDGVRDGVLQTLRGAVKDEKKQPPAPSHTNE
jgi:DNA-binding Xre family transcriptional regulator